MAFKGEDEMPKAVILDLADDLFLCKSDSDVPADVKAAANERVLSCIREHSMTHYYKHAAEVAGFAPDEKLVAEMEAKNAEELKGIEEKITDAKENLGDTEVRDFMLEKSEFYSRIGNKDAALETYDETAKISASLGQKLDMVFAKIRLGLFFNDTELVKKMIEKANELLLTGGDWERRNRLKVYEGLYNMLNRDFKKAAELFLSALATFTCTELFEYERFVFYTTVLSLVALDRATLTEKVVKAPEILSVYEKTAHLPALMNDLYQSNFRGFFEALVGISDTIKADCYLSRHIRYFVREIRIVAYKQFLESYKSVTMDAMATEFGVSTGFLDREISHYIAAGRINAKIDKVAGAIETNRPDYVNAHYQDTIKKGDQLLNSLQKLARVIDV
jgi:26S proteasome regulatory subunit N7